METNPNSEEKANRGTARKIVTALIVLAVFVALVLAARYLVSSVDIMELLKKLHGG
jgi:hypothetical protein